MTQNQKPSPFSWPSLLKTLETLGQLTEICVHLIFVDGSLYDLEEAKSSLKASFLSLRFHKLPSLQEGDVEALKARMGLNMNSCQHFLGEGCLFLFEPLSDKSQSEVMEAWAKEALPSLFSRRKDNQDSQDSGTLPPLPLLRSLRHDIRSPLMSMEGIAALLRDDKTLSEEERTKFLELLLQEVHRVRPFVEDVFSLLALPQKGAFNRAFKFYATDFIQKTKRYFDSHQAARSLSLALPSPPSRALLLSEMDESLLMPFIHNLWGHFFRMAGKEAHFSFHLGQNLEGRPELSVEARGDGFQGGFWENPLDHAGRSRAEGKGTRDVGLGLLLVKKIGERYGWEMHYEKKEEDGLVSGHVLEILF